MKNMRRRCRTLLWASLLLLAPFVALAQQSVLQAKDDWYQVALYTCVVMLSAFCGSITFARQYLADDGVKHKLIRWFVDAGTAIISGLVCFWFAQSQGWGLWLTNVLVAATAMGWASIIDIVRSAIGSARADREPPDK